MPNYTNLSNQVFGPDDEVTDVYTIQKFPMGTYREEDGKGYRFGQFDNGTGNLTAAANLLVYHFADTGTFVFTTDVSDSDRNKVRGVLVSVPADQGYMWIQTKGPCTVATNGDDDIAEGDAVIASAAGDGTADSTAQDTAPTNRVVGWALAADSDGANTVLVDLVLD